jgi:dTMP kinase
MTGRLVVFEGIDGCGKTTQLERLRRWLPSSGLMGFGTRLLVTREPGGTPLGQALRALLLQPPEASAPCSLSELLMYAADRAQHVDQVLRPALAAGHWVLCDRFTGSTVAYQGYGRGLPLLTISQLEGIATGGLKADLTLWLDLPLEESLRRRGDRVADRIESGGEGFLQRVCDGFAALAVLHDWKRVDAAMAPDRVEDRCRCLIVERLGASSGPQADG